MADLTAYLKENPLVAGGIVLSVALLAYLQSRNTGGVAVSDYAFRGNVAAPIDPNAAAISEAAISAGTQNLGTIAQLVGLQDTNRTQLAGLEDSNNASLTASLANTSASRDVSLAGIAANLKAALFQTEAQRDTSLAETAGNVTIAQGNTAEQLAAANLTDSYNRTALKAQQDMYALAQGTERFQIQSQKDIARANANTGLVHSLFGAGLALFGL